MPALTNLKRLLKKSAFNLKNGLNETKLFEQQGPKTPKLKNQSQATNSVFRSKVSNFVSRSTF